MALALAVAMAFPVPAEAQEPLEPPVIEAVFPPGAWPGTPVSIQGRNFGALQVPGLSRVTFNGVDAGTATLWSENYILVAVPGGATSGPVVVSTMLGDSNPYPFTVYEQEPQFTSYFAEGTTRAGFEEWLTILNPYDSQYTATVTYMVAQGANRIRYYNLPARSRVTVNVNSEIGSGRDVSLSVSAAQRLYAERSLYFDYGGSWKGGHCSVPATEASDRWYFAEGTTRAGFEEWLCLANPGAQEAQVTVRYCGATGEAMQQDVLIAPRRRVSIDVNSAVGAEKDVALEIVSTQPIVAERPMYFAYRGAWDGGHITVGATETSDRWYFAEGTTRAGFEEWLCLANPGAQEAQVTVRYCGATGEAMQQDVLIAPRRRVSIDVNSAVGAEKDVALEIVSTQPIVAERPMYFAYRGAWDGGHITVGATETSDRWYFAEGTTRAGFEEWLCLANPGAQEAQVHIDYFFQGGEVQGQDLHVQAGSRVTVYVNQAVGEGRDVAVKVSSQRGIVAERSMYFLYRGGWDGGHNTLGMNL
ncbi:MAG: IPT/TIG domain-containing protein [Actinobacteria bacterium]|nr:IPT/TIG domain-containing protein [Actinomycetota bacterium]